MNLATSTSVKALTVAAFLAFAPVAYAFDASGNPLADTLMSNLEASGATDVSAEAVTGNSGNAEILNLTATSKADGEDAKVSIERITISNGDVVDGKLSAGEITMDGLRIESKDATVTAVSGRATDITMPSADDIKAKSPSLSADSKYGQVEINGLTIASEDGVNVPIGHIALEASDYVGDIARKFSLSVDNLSIAKSMLDGQGQAMFDRLGYDNLMLSLSLDGTWDDSTGIGDIKKFALTGKDVGTLSLTARVGGLTPDVVAKLKTMDGGNNPQEAMQLLQGLTVESLMIRFDNDSVVERGLDAQAKEMGTTRDALAAQLSGALPLMLSALQNPGFQKKVGEAATTFLKERKTIIASANPAQPIPVAQIFGTAMVAPQSIPDVLGVDVTTNP